MINIAINGFGRIGRMAFRAILKHPDLRVVAVNDLSDARTLAYLLKYDSVHQPIEASVSAEGDTLIVNGNEIKVLSCRDIDQLPWRELGVDIVLESTGRNKTRQVLNKHLNAGAKKVILTVPAETASDVDATVVLGVNDAVLNPDLRLISNASCTTNCISPIVKVVHEKFGIKHGLINTVHSFTNDQKILDQPHADFRKARAMGVSIIPTSSGAAKAVGLVLPELKGKLDGFAMRVPVPDVSVVDMTLQLMTTATKDEINREIQQAADSYLQGIVQYTDEPLVSVDIIDNCHSSIFDSSLTMVMDGNYCKLVIWYDNEMGYSNRLAELASRIGKFITK